MSAPEPRKFRFSLKTPKTNQTISSTTTHATIGGKPRKYAPDSLRFCASNETFPESPRVRAVRWRIEADPAKGRIIVTTPDIPAGHLDGTVMSQSIAGP